MQLWTWGCIYPLESVRWFFFSDISLRMELLGHVVVLGFPGSWVVKNLLANAGDVRDAGSISGSGRSSGGGNDNPLQHSCLEKSMDKGAWQDTGHEVTKSQTWLRDYVCTAVIVFWETVTSFSLIHTLLLSNGTIHFSTCRSCIFLPLCLDFC